MKILAIDPGPAESAWVVLTGYSCEALPDVEEFGKEASAGLLARIDSCGYGAVVIEKIASYGMPVGAEIFETVFWSGRFAERAWITGATSVERIERLRVKLQLCRDSRAKDANIRQALIDRYGGPGAIKKGGPLYKVSKDAWAALAVGVTYWETRRLRERD